MRQTTTTDTSTNAIKTVRALPCGKTGHTRQSGDEKIRNRVGENQKGKSGLTWLVGRRWQACRPTNEDYSFSQCLQPSRWLHRTSKQLITDAPWTSDYMGRVRRNKLDRTKKDDQPIVSQLDSPVNSEQTSRAPSSGIRCPPEETSIPLLATVLTLLFGLQSATVLARLQKSGTIKGTAGGARRLQD